MLHKHKLILTTLGVCSAVFCASPFANAQSSSPGMSNSSSTSDINADTNAGNNNMNTGSTMNSGNMAGGNDRNTGGSQNFVLGSNLMGSHLKNQQNEDLGTISNIVVNPQTGHIRYAVVNADGKKVTIPWSAINAQNNSGNDTPTLTANVTKDKLSNAPKFDSDNMQNLQSRSTEEPIWTYYELVWFPDVSSSDEQNARGQGNNSSTAGGGNSGTIYSRNNSGSTTGTSGMTGTTGSTGTSSYPNTTPSPSGSPH
jgi:hypothetical protein